MSVPLAVCVVLSRTCEPLCPKSRLNNVMVLHVHKNLTDKLSLVDIGNNFISGSSRRESLFGKCGRCGYGCGLRASPLSKCFLHPWDVVSITSQDSMPVQSTPDSDSIALCNMTDDELVKNCTRIVVPKGKREDILMAGHNNPLAGHLGLKKNRE